jgi:cardiolipin synthase
MRPSTAMVADIDAAQDHVHLLFYIWLPDNNGCKVVEALKRAAARGVTCRAMADGLGSRIMIHSEHWQAMRKAGVHLAVALPIGNPLLRPLKGRIDLRNHRKIVVIDDVSPIAAARTVPTRSFWSRRNMPPGWTP